ncbi:MAG: 30S ribosomal protein S4 [Proteobacteria bacterium]|nr:30S ribosomal protein S4 [Pseudomonadota bacterium]
MAQASDHKRHHAKHKIDRRLGVNLWGRPKSPINTREYGPGQHGQRRGKPSDYRIQLMAKQKLKGYYGNIGEKQFKRYYLVAVRKRGDTGQNLIGLLESRLDAVVYRMKLAPTVFAARQLVNHKHVLVNGRICNIPSALLNAGDKVELTDKGKGIPSVLDAEVSAERDVPNYLKVDYDNVDSTKLGFKKGVLSRIPGLDDVPYPVRMEPNLVIEYYSR